MDLTTFTYSGFLERNYDDDGHFETLKLVDGKTSVDLVKKFRAIFDLFESEVSVAFFTSKEKKTEKEMLSGWLEYLHGEITADHETNSYHYSSYNGTDYDTSLKIGGHNLFNEWSEHLGKWFVVKITLKRA